VSTNTAVLEARKTVTMLFAAGLAMLIVGVILAAATWPHTKIDAISGTSEAKGSALVAMLALGVAGVGQLLAAIAVVAWGVRFGMESAAPGSANPSVGPKKPGSRRVWLEKEGRFVDESDVSAPCD
jgi:hypothetical protein